MTAPLSIRRRAALFLFLATLLALLTGYAFERILFFDRPLITPLVMEGKWIRPPGDLDYRGCFRKTVFLNSYPKQAWLMISAQDGFEVIVNGQTVNHLFFWRPTRQFQSDLSESGQRAKYYRLTAAGKRQLATERTRWEQVVTAISGVLNPGAKAV